MDEEALLREELEKEESPKHSLAASPRIRSKSPGSKSKSPTSSKKASLQNEQKNVKAEIIKKK